LSNEDHDCIRQEERGLGADRDEAPVAGRETLGCFSAGRLDSSTQSAEPPCTWPVRTVVWEGGAVRLLPIPISHLMYSCPACHQRTISVLRKWWSAPALPATCSSCGKHCLVPSSRSSDIAVALVVFATVCGFVAAALKSVLPLAIGIIAALFFYVRRWHRATLQIISPEDVESARKESNAFSLVVLLLWFMH